MKRRMLLSVGMSALMLAALMPGAAVARSPGERFGRVDTSLGGARLDLLPSRQDPNRKVVAMVELAGRPVAIAQGEALEANPARPLTEAQKASVRRPLLNRQRVVASQIRSAGARILGTYTDAYHGIKVRATVGQLNRIARLNGVIGVREMQVHLPSNVNTVDYTGTDNTWGATGLTGNGVVIAVIDSGINYYHRNFAGAGIRPYRTDNGLSRADGNFPTAKVIEGYDFVGDDYNPSDDDDTNDEGEPDNDPLDCKDPASPNVQHGSHVAGTAAGTGVRSNGTTYTGSYNASTLSNVDFRIGPGTAPRAKLLAYRVFGCDGGTFYTVDAIERAVRQGADVINMSLGSPWGNPQDPAAVASDNASLAGVVVVASAGNSGPGAYITGAPAVATRAISVAAMDAVPSFPSASIDMPSGPDIRAINANDHPGLPVTGAFEVLEDDPTTADSNESLGCAASDYKEVDPGEIAVTVRGVCARVDRAVLGDDAGAVAVIMINNADGFPPFEGPIPGADVPFLGVPSSNGPALRAADGDTVTIRDAADLANPAFRHTASFTSGGPRRYDNQLKPDIAAPGVSVFSTQGSSTSQGKGLSGTSMSSPAVAGIAALVRQSKPTWSPVRVKAAIIGTANPGKLVPYDMRIAGSGLVRPRRAVSTFAFASTNSGNSSLVFGYEQIERQPTGTTAYAETTALTLWNTSSSAVTYRLSNAFNGPSLGMNVAISPSSVTVPANSNRRILVTLSLSNANAAALPGQGGLAADDFGQLFTALTTIKGAITATPTAGNNASAGRFDIRVPWLVAPRGLSKVEPSPLSPYSQSGGVATTRTKLQNYGIHSGNADVYAWGLSDGGAENLDNIDLRAVGAQSIDPAFCDSGAAADDACLVFAVNIWGRLSAPSEAEFDILIDTDEDGEYDYAVFGLDIGLIFGVFSGVYGSFVLDLNTFELVSVYFAEAPNNTSTILLPVLASDLGLADGQNQDFDYFAASFQVADDGRYFDDIFQGGQDGRAFEPANFDAFDHPLSNGNFVPLDSGQSETINLSVRRSTYDPREGHKGWMFVTMDDRNGADQADTLPVGNLP